MKDTVILLIFLLAVTGLVIGVCCTEDTCSENSHHSDYKRVYEESDGVLTVSLEKNNESDLSRYFT